MDKITIKNIKFSNSTAANACVDILKNSFEFKDICANSNNQIDVDSEFYNKNSEQIRLIARSFVIGYNIGFDDAEYKFNRPCQKRQIID